MTVNGTGGLSNGSTSEINIEGSATVQATLNVANAAAGFGTAGVETGTVFLQNDALLEFKSGQITTVNGELWLDGANSRVADAGKLTSNSALTGLSSVSGDFFLENGATVAPTGNVSVTGNGVIELDGNNIGGSGGSGLTIGGNLSNTSTNGNGIDVGNTGITSADTLTVNGTGGLSNGSTSEINIEGSATVQATLNVADKAAGFGTANTETGEVFLENDALLQFKSGQITTVDGTLWLDGAKSRVASGTKLTTNSALTGLTSVAGNFWLENGATVSPTGNVSVTGSGTVELDGNNTGGTGGAKLTITGTLTNSSTSGNGVDIGNTGITSADTLTVKGTGGLSNGSTSEINIEGSATVRATLNVSGAAAGFGTAGTETGEVFLENDALLEFKSGQIATVNGTLWLDGAKSFVADAGKLTTNSALTGLTGVAGNFWLENGATVSPTGNVSVTGSGTVELDGPNTGGSGGATLTIGGTLTNSSTNGNAISVGNTGITSADMLTVNGAGGLSNTGDINIEGGSASATANLVVTNAVTSSAGTIFLNSFGDLTASAVNITGGTLEGTGTVTGALNDTGGTVVGGILELDHRHPECERRLHPVRNRHIANRHQHRGFAAIEHHQRDRNSGDAGRVRQRQSRRRDPAHRRRKQPRAEHALYGDDLRRQRPLRPVRASRNRGFARQPHRQQQQRKSGRRRYARGPLQRSERRRSGRAGVDSGEHDIYLGCRQRDLERLERRRLEPAGQWHDAERHFQCGDWHRRRRNSNIGARPDDQQSVDHLRLHAFRRHPLDHRRRERFGRVRRRAVDRRHERRRQFHG